MRKLEYKKGEAIFREGDLGECLYEIGEGSVDILLGYGEADEKKLTTLEAGRVFGEMAVLESWPRSATAVSADDHTVLLEISSDEMEAFFREDPAQIRLIMSNLSRRLRELTDDYKEVCTTIRQIKETRGETEEREEGLLAKIGRFMNIYSRYLGSRKVLEAMETYDTIEQIKAQKGEQAEGVRFDQNEIIFRQGDPGDSIYYIAWGRVGIYTDYGTSQQKELTTLGEDRFFGELGLIEKLPRTATVVALENGTILNRITDESLDEMFSSHPAIILKLLRHISSRLRKLTLDYVKACRTVTRMIAEEEGRPQLTEEDLQRIEEAVLMAQISSNAYWY